MPALIDILSYLSAAILIFLGLMFLIAATIEPTRVFPGLALLLLGLGVIYVNRQLKRAKLTEEMLETLVIKFAQREGGVVTVAEVSAGLNIPVDVAKRVLERLERKGLAFLDFERIGDEGVEVYRILGIKGEE
ncbi:MAG: hypothetical protein J7J65_01195 [Candidatus Korarchaeota archaeon]|nr:hypothetical protein [Candidatus Korarchaeota archaeon]